MERTRMNGIGRAVMRAGLLAAAGLLAVLAGCQLGGVPAAEAEDAKAIAAEIADPSSGVTQEIEDLGAYLFGEPAAKGPVSRAARFLAGHLGEFQWNAETGAYERTREVFDLVLENRVVHVARVFVSVKFYSSADGSGEPFQPVLGPALDSNVHSIGWHREVTGTAEHTLSGAVSGFSAESDLLYSSIDTAAGTVTVDGTHGRSFTRTFENGRTVEGSVAYVLSGLEVVRDPVTGTLSWAGTLQYDYDATVTRVNGTQVQRTRSGTVAFEGSSTFTVTTDGGTWRCSLVDGSLVP
jgi:hypothetical protein